MRPYIPQHLQAQQAQPPREQGLYFFGKYYSQLAIQYFLGALVASNLFFISHTLSPLFWVFSILEVVFFFSYANTLSRKWSTLSAKFFTRKLFWTAFGIRLAWVLFSYFFYSWQTGQPFEWDAADAQGYHGEASWLVDLIQAGKLQTYFDYIHGRYSDMGYAFYLGIQYLVTGKSILIARILKAVYGAFTVVLIYRLATRNFGESVGRVAAILTLCMPNLILYTGLHLKEVEMVMLVTLYIEQTDKLMRERVFSFSTLILPVLSGLALFFFRTVLGITAVFALFSSLILTTDKVMGLGKRLLLLLWILVAGAYFVGGAILTEVEEVWMNKDTNQSTSMEWRANREGGNKFSKYASGAVFAPMIFVIPFPTVVETPNQENQKIIAGGNYVKNILAFFALWGLVLLLKERKWREHMLILSFTLSYLLVIALSAFAQSERFHQPALPFELILAAYGLSRFEKKQRKYFRGWLFFILCVIIAWSWFKLAGRGMA